MPDERQTSTLFDTEYRLRTVTRTVTLACLALSVAACLWGGTRVEPRLLAAAALLSAACHLSNLRHLLTHQLPTVGMMPVAAFGLLAPMTALAVSPQVTGVAHLVAAACAAMGLPLLLLFLGWFARLRACYRTHPHVQPDAVLVVLGGAVRHGQPGVTLTRRLDVAASCWRESPHRILLPSGGPTVDLTSTEADVMARYLRERGVPSEAIVLEPRARNTRENIAYSLELAYRHAPGRQVCVVSSDYHLWRALREARALGVTLTPVPARTPRDSVPQQWCREVLTILFGR